MKPHPRLRRAALVSGAVVSVLLTPLLGCRGLHRSPAEREPSTVSSTTPAQRSPTEPSATDSAPDQAAENLARSVIEDRLFFALDPASLPEEWKGPPTLLGFTEISGEHQVAALPVRGALACYPTALIPRVLDKVYVLETLTWKGVSVAGLFHDRTLFIAQAQPDSKAPVMDVALCVHHEMSSLLLTHYWALFPAEEWLEANPPDFKYLMRPLTALSPDQLRVRADPELAMSGFLAPYCQVSAHEDVNIVASHLFTGSPVLWEYVERSPRLKAKVNLAVRFYEAIDPQFTEEFFRTQVAGGLPAPTPSSAMNPKEGEAREDPSSGPPFPA